MENIDYLNNKLKISGKDLEKVIEVVKKAILKEIDNETIKGNTDLWIEEI